MSSKFTYEGQRAFEMKPKAKDHKLLCYMFNYINWTAAFCLLTFEIGDVGDTSNKRDNYKKKKKKKKSGLQWSLTFCRVAGLKT